MKKKLVFLSILLLIFTVSAFTDADIAILSIGPIGKEGIELLQPSNILAMYGEYVFKNQLIKIYFTEEKVELATEWEKTKSGSIQIKQNILSGDKKVISYTDKRGWTVFIFLKNDTEGIPNFLETYIKRQNYFISIAGDKDIFSFPAILEIE